MRLTKSTDVYLYKDSDSSDFYSSDHKLETLEDGVTISPSQIKDILFIGSLWAEWSMHKYIAEDYFSCTDDFNFNGVYYDITHLIPDLINSFNDDECKYMFPLFKDILWELAQGKRIIYSGDY